MPTSYKLEHPVGEKVTEEDPNRIALTQFLPQNGQGTTEGGKAAEKKVKEQVDFFQLFRFADGIDKSLMIFGAIGGLLQAVGMQILPFLIFGVVNEFSVLQTPNSTSNIDPQEILDLIPRATTPIAIVIIVDLIFAFLCVCLWSYSAERQTQKVRKLAFHRILHMHIGWFDRHLGGELNSRLAEDASRYQNGIGDKVGLVIHWFCMFLVALTFAMIISWRVTLVTLATIPVVIGAAVLSGWSAKASAEMEGNAYAKAGSVAEEALANIRIVAAFSGEETEGKNYQDLLLESRAVAVKSGAITAISQGLSWLIIFSIASLIYWYGGILVERDQLQPGDIFMIFMMMVSGSRSLAFAAPNLEAINAAQSSAYALYRIIDDKSECDSSLDIGKKPDPKDIKGEVSFEGVRFSYPQRKDTKVLKGLTMTIRPGQSAALVGPSGCGKSTTIQLLQRLYDPDGGQVKIDGHSVSDVNLKWLRDQIGVVSQEPILFAATIAENIKFGREGCTMDEVYKASKEASAHDFIKKLPHGYETVLNEQGTQLSRGEKQRISLARALIRCPKILLLDECTSALDTESEAVVQKALDKASAGRTTIIIAHRLSTVRDANVLFIINNGVVEECGNHKELMAKKGLYNLLVSNQVGDDEKVEEIDKPLPEIPEVRPSPPVVQVERPPLSRSTSERPTLSRSTSVVSMLSLSDDGGRTLSAASLAGVLIGSPLPNLDLSMEDGDEYPEVAWSRLLKMNALEWPYMTIGGIASVISGLVWPAFAYFFGLTVQALVSPDMNAPEGDRHWLLTSIYAVATFVLGLVAGFIQFTMGFAFKFAGEGLTHRMRVTAFTTMLRQEIGWFDDDHNQVGTLTSKLANEASRVKMATGPALSALLQASSTAIFASVLAITLSWQLGLAMLPLIPIGAAVTIAQGYFNKSFAVKSQEAIETSGKIASEAMDKIRTVTALNKEDYFMTKYQLNFDSLKKAARKRAVIMGTTWAMMWFTAGMNYVIAVGFGLYLVAHGQIEFHNIYTILAVAVLASLELGRANAYAPEFTSAKAAAARLFALFDRESKLDPLDTSGKGPELCLGEVTLESVNFFYPTRPSIRVLHNLSLHATRGQSLALVGPSGGGKSAIIQLMERFYDVKTGSVELDGHNVKSLRTSWLRHQISIVTQEPILFAKSIKDNIAYGDTSRNVPFEEIVEAAKAANIHSFITTLPLGYDTNVGGKGTQLSGGQKQRVSIARALLRNPKILLLDDATSALDSESEKVVEEALQLARKGRTSIVVSHRLSSIVNASQILYVDKGRVLERGTHEELMDRKQLYYGLQLASHGQKTEHS